MHASTLIASFLSLLLAGQTLAAPAMPFPLRRAIASRDVAGHEIAPNDTRADSPPKGIISVYARQFSDSSPGMAPNGVLIPFKNGSVGRRQISDVEATMAPDGVVVPFSNTKRQIPDTEATMAPDGIVKPFQNGKRAGSRAPSDNAMTAEKRQFSDSQPGMAPDGVLIPFKNGRRGAGKRRLPTRDETE